MHNQIPLQPANLRTNTFLVRSLNGMTINVEIENPAGVNVHIGGAVHLDGATLLSGNCTADRAGTFNVKNGCFYFCDGRRRQSFNVAFDEATTNTGSKRGCEFDTRCEFDGIHLRPGDKVNAYSAPRASNCNNVFKEITCNPNDNTDFTTYKYSYCMPWDNTTLDMKRSDNTTDIKIIDAHTPSSLSS